VVIDVSACCVLADIGVAGGIAGGVVATFVDSVNGAEDNDACVLDVTNEHVRDWHMHMVVGFVEQSC
jgi:hypothetical protein